MATPSLTIGTAVPLNAGYNLDPTDIVFVDGNNFITLTAGYYHVTFDGNASIAAAGTVALVIQIDGITIQRSISAVTIASGTTAVLSTSIIIQITADSSAFSLVSAGENSTTYSNLNLVIKKLTVN